MYNAQVLGRVTTALPFFVYKQHYSYFTSSFVNPK